MPARRRHTSTHKATAQAESVETEAPEPQKPETARPMVTQVVEVIEEGDVPPAVEKKIEELVEEQVGNMGVMEESEDHIIEEEMPAESLPVSTPETQEARKEMVEVLYGSKHPPTIAPEISMHSKKRSTKPVIVWALVTIVVALLSGLVLFTLSKKSFSLPSVFVAPTPTPTPTITPTPTPTPMAVDKESLTVQVLNGGGTPGAASKMKKLLEEKGYTVTDTGNTEEYTYDTTEIHVKPGKEGAIPLLESDLKEDYSLGESAADLPDDASYDVRVIVGKE